MPASKAPPGRKSLRPRSTPSKAPARPSASKATPSKRPSKRSEPQISARPAGPPKKRIVVADDDAAIAKMLVRVLEPDYEVSWAKDGPQAFAQATAEPPPQLVLLDVMMPGFDGFGVAQRLKLVPRARRIPILFITARDAPADIVHGIQVGARGYIVKPFNVKELLDKVRKLLGD